MLDDLVRRQQKRDIVLFYGAADPDAIVFHDVIESAQKYGIVFVPVIQTPPASWTGESGFVTPELINKHVSDLTKRTIYISGPPRMVDTLSSSLKKAGVSGRRIVTDHFNGY
jgi:glycine betaine catabolism B